MKKKLIELAANRTQFLADAENALREGKHDDYTSAMQKVENVNKKIKDVQDLLHEQARKLDMAQESPAEAKDRAEELGHLLMTGNEVKLSAREVKNSITLATGTLAQPTGAGANIRDGIGLGPSSIVDQVSVVDLTGMAGFQEPYVITEPTAGADDIASLAGTARTATTDPTFGVAEIKPYEMNVTSYVDRNISRLTPANYFAKVQGMALRALRRKAAALILNGDSETTHIFHGFKTATNKAGSSIFATQNVTSIDVNILDTLYFAYGSASEIGPNARLLLTKADLKAIGALRGTNEKRRLFTITPDAGNPNTGIISDGGVVIPYTICSDLTSLSTATQGSTAIQTMIYGDPLNYELGLFGDYTIRVDESVKAVERMYAILGDAFIGGNLVVHNGAVVATLPAASVGG